MGQSPPLLWPSSSHSQLGKKLPDSTPFILQEASEAPSSCVAWGDSLGSRRESVLGSLPPDGSASPTTLWPSFFSYWLGFKRRRCKNARSNTCHYFQHDSTWRGFYRFPVMVNADILKLCPAPAMHHASPGPLGSRIRSTDLPGGRRKDSRRRQREPQTTLQVWHLWWETEEEGGNSAALRKPWPGRREGPEPRQPMRGILGQAERPGSRTPATHCQPAESTAWEKTLRWIPKLQRYFEAVS